MPFSPTISDEATHPPARSETPTAWITLGLIGLLLAGWIFSGQIAAGVIRVALFGTMVARGEQLHVEKISLDPNGAIALRGIEWNRGAKEHRSSLKCDWAMIRLSSPWPMILGAKGKEGPWIREIVTGKAKLLADLRDTPSREQASKSGKDAPVGMSWVLPAQLLPSSFAAGPVDVVVIGETFRLAVNGLQLNLPDRWPGKISLGGATVDVGSRHATVPKGTAPAIWDGSTLRCGTLGLGEGMALKELTLTPMKDRLEFGLRGVIGKGILRGDGSLGRAGQRDRLEVTLVGERLGLEAFGGFLKDPKQATGTISQARFTFRGNPSRPLEADSALRLIAKNFRWEGKGWESLRIAATLTGRTLTLSELLLRQGENELEAEGQSRLPEDWRTILRAPFSATFSATLADAGSLAAIAGPEFGRLGGGLAFEGEIHGAENKAEGYCNVAGYGARIRDLPVDWLKGNILFEGEKTHVTYFEACSGEDRIVGEGTVANGRPHAYSAKAEVSVKSLTGRLAQLGLDTASAIGSGSVKGTWQGEGSMTNHGGSFRAKVTDWVSSMTREGLSGRFEGSYGGGRLELTKADFFQDDLTISMQLALTPGNISATAIKAVREGTGKPLLEGEVTLPVDANDFRASGNLVRTLVMDRPLLLDLRMRGIKAEDLAEALGQKSGFGGTLDGDISVKGTPATPEIKSTLRVGKFTTQSEAAGQDLKLVGETRDHRLYLSVDQDPTTKAPLALRATLPLQLANDHGQLRFAENGSPIEGSLRLQQTPLDGWFFLLGTSGHCPLLGATATGEVKVVGTVGKPAVEGSLTVVAREATLFGPEKLRTINLPFLMEGKSPVMVLNNGTATYDGKTVSLTGTVTLAGDAAGVSLKILGNELPVSFGSAFATTGTADLQLTTAATGTVLGGTLTLKPSTADLGRGLTSCFAPPGLAIGGNLIAPPRLDEALPNLQLALEIKTSGDPTNADNPLISVDLLVKGSAQAPKVTGKVTAVNQTLRLPAGSFLLPEARLLFEGSGARLDPAPAYGFTRIGPFVLTPAFDGTGTSCGIAGPAGKTAADVILALECPSTMRGENTHNAAPILQGISWLRQQTLFPLPAVPWSTPFRESPAAGSLGFYGTPWIWNWSDAPIRTQPNNTSR